MPRSTAPPPIALVAALALLTALAACPTVMAASSAPDKPDPDTVLRMLKEGNERFATGRATHDHTGPQRLRLAETENQGDHAYATVITCSDSRVPVERLFDAGVMHIFTVRVAGNVIRTHEAGSIEYGLAHVHTPVLVVLGHTQCGAVSAVADLVQGRSLALERNIPPLLAPIFPAVERAAARHPDLHGERIIPAAIEENIWQAMRDLFLRSPATRRMVRTGEVKVAGAVYDVGTGVVSWLPEEPVASILDAVERDPDRATAAMAPPETLRP